MTATNEKETKAMNSNLTAEQFEALENEDQMSDEERRIVAEYEERVAGIPDFFDLINDFHWDGYYQPEGERLTLAEGSALYAGWVADIHKWFAAADDLRNYFRGTVTTEFHCYVMLQRENAKNALFYLGQRALHELGAKGWMYA